MGIYDRIKTLCAEKGVTITGTEKELGFARGSLCKIDKSKPSAERLNKLADYFGVRADWIMGESIYKTQEDLLKHYDESTDFSLIHNQLKEVKVGTTDIPVLGQVAAGIPIFASENYIGYETISKDMAKDGDYFGLKIKGDSMSPRISEGDTVIVKKQDDAESGDIVIVLINGDSATCKRLMKYQHGISLLSFNPAYAPMEYTNQQIQDLPVKVIGKVVENRQKY